MLTKFYNKLLLSLVLLVTNWAFIGCACNSGIKDINSTLPPQPVINYTFSIVNAYSHDRDAFTQGLAFANENLYEGTGIYGKSSLRRVELETGRILQMQALPVGYFAEGITVFQDTIIQITWKSKRGFVYDRSTFELQRTFSYETQGWGIMHDGEHLIMSTGSSTLYFLNPDTFEVTNQILVHDGDQPISNLNELEYIGHQIYANVWPTNTIVIIDPCSGRITGRVNFSGLLTPPNDGKPIDVLNGIAYDSDLERLFVTGKWWPQLFEIKLIIQDRSSGNSTSSTSTKP